MPHQKMNHNEPKIPELGAIENDEQGSEPGQINAKKANGGQLYDQHIMNEYCKAQVGLASVPEGFKSEDENDSWQLQSIKSNQSRKMSDKYELSFDESLHLAKANNLRDHLSHNAPIV